MSGIGVHGFEIPHLKAKPTRDMIIIRIPMPPRKIGSIDLPDVTRDILVHNVMVGQIVAMGPLAFSYKDANGLQRQDANIGDWAEIRPFAGTMAQGGKIAVTNGFRYVSSFQDVIGVLAAADMPDPATLEWGDEEETRKPAPVETELTSQPRSSERIG